MKPMIYKPSREVTLLDSGTYKGIDYIILSLGSHPTAYVRVPKNHLYFKVEDHNIYDIECHGGLTYSNETVKKSDKKGWWLGWDYAHLGDYTGYDGLSLRTGDRKWSTEEILDEVKNVIEQLKGAKNEHTRSI